MLQSPDTNRKLPWKGISNTWHQLIREEIYQLKAFEETVKRRNSYTRRIS